MRLILIKDFPRCARPNKKAKAQAVAKKSKGSVPFKSFSELSIVSIFFLFPLFFLKEKNNAAASPPKADLRRCFSPLEKKKGKKKKKYSPCPPPEAVGKKEKEEGKRGEKTGTQGELRAVKGS